MMEGGGRIENRHGGVGGGDHTAKMNDVSLSPATHCKWMGPQSYHQRPISAEPPPHPKKKKVSKRKKRKG